MEMTLSLKNLKPSRRILEAVFKVSILNWEAEFFAFNSYWEQNDVGDSRVKLNVRLIHTYKLNDK